MSFDLELQHEGRGRRADYAFGVEPLGWRGVDVVRFHAKEEISRPYSADITLVRRADQGPVDLDALLGLPASLRIASEARFRPIHGIIDEVAEIEQTSQLFLYHVRLVPPFAKAKLRKRCRSWCYKTLETILVDLLENKSYRFPNGHGGLVRFDGDPPELTAIPSFDSFRPALGYYKLDVQDTSLLENATFRYYTVQYNESDFDVFSRLIEEIGISYVFDHTDDGVIMRLTDRPSAEPSIERDRTVRVRSSGEFGHGRDQEAVRWYREARRLRSRAVAMRDFSFRRALTPPEAAVHAEGLTDDEAELSEHYEFPAREEAIEDRPCEVASRVRLERFEVERNTGTGSGNVRTIEPGQLVMFTDIHGVRPDGQNTIVSVETFATQLGIDGTLLTREPFGFEGTAQTPGAYENRFTAIPESLPFRPARSTPHPRIDGVQSANVTAEELSPEPEINSDPTGRVRVRFPWDRRPPDGTPTSGFIRVSQIWAGAGFGGMFIPRVGQEVLVAFLQGDPERPVIVGRVYNEQRTPPYDFEQKNTVSTVKSKSSPQDDGFNEFRFEDKKGEEQIYIHAQKDFDEKVLHNHSTSVDANQTNSVGGNRTHSVTGEEGVTVKKDRNTRFEQNENHYVEYTRTTEIGLAEIVNVHGNRSRTIDYDDMRIVHGTDLVIVDGTRDVVSKQDQTNKTTGTYTSTASSNHVFTSSNTYIGTGVGGGGATGQIHLKSAELETWQRTFTKLHVGHNHVEITPAMVKLCTDGGAVVSLAGGAVTITAPGGLVVNGQTVQIHATGGAMTLDASSSVNIEARGGDVVAHGTSNVKLNC